MDCNIIITLTIKINKRAKNEVQVFSDCNFDFKESGFGAQGNKYIVSVLV